MIVLLETYRRLLSASKNIYQRNIFHQIKPLNRIMGIVGGRGVGKTTCMLQYLKKHYPDSTQALYVSADHLYFADYTLVGLADQFYKEFDGNLLCIDEIHRYPNWNQELKNIYDAYPKMTVIFSGSSSLSLKMGKHDLSRRCFIQPMSGFSFREFLEERSSQKIPSYSLTEMTQQPQKISQGLSGIPRLIGLFKEYLRRGYYPIYTELHDDLAYQQALINVIDKTIFEDISSYYSIKTEHLNTFKKLLYYVATIPPGNLNINKLAVSLQKDHSTIAGYLEMLLETGLLRFLLNDKTGHSLIRNAEKIYLANTNLAYAITETLGKEEMIGSLRELFVLSHLSEAGYQVFYSEAGDFFCDGFVFEIGGPGKTRRQIKNTKNAFLIQDDILIGDSHSLPLYLLGLVAK